MAHPILIGLLAQQALDGDPLPLGWVAVGGALGLTVFTIAALRRYQRWGITDLEAALTRRGDELTRSQEALTTERTVSDTLRARLIACQDEKQGLRLANVGLVAENQALQAEVQRLNREVRQAEAAALDYYQQLHPPRRGIAEGGHSGG